MNKQVPSHHAMLALWGAVFGIVVAFSSVLVSPPDAYAVTLGGSSPAEDHQSGYVGNTYNHTGNTNNNFNTYSGNSYGYQAPQSGQQGGTQVGNGTGGCTSCGGGSTGGYGGGGSNFNGVPGYFASQYSNPTASGASSLPSFNPFTTLNTVVSNLYTYFHSVNPPESLLVGIPGYPHYIGQAPRDTTTVVVVGANGSLQSESFADYYNSAPPAQTIAQYNFAKNGFDAASALLNAAPLAGSNTLIVSSEDATAVRQAFNNLNNQLDRYYDGYQTALNRLGSNSTQVAQGAIAPVSANSTWNNVYQASQNFVRPAPPPSNARTSTTIAAATNILGVPPSSSLLNNFNTVAYAVGINASTLMGLPQGVLNAPTPVFGTPSSFNYRTTNIFTHQPQRVTVSVVQVQLQHNFSVNHVSLVTAAPIAGVRVHTTLTFRTTPEGRPLYDPLRDPSFSISDDGLISMNGPAYDAFQTDALGNPRQLADRIADAFAGLTAAALGIPPVGTAASQIAELQKALDKRYPPQTQTTQAALENAFRQTVLNALRAGFLHAENTPLTSIELQDTLAGTESDIAIAVAVATQPPNNPSRNGVTADIGTFIRSHIDNKDVTNAAQIVTNRTATALGARPDPITNTYVGGHYGHSNGGTNANGATYYLYTQEQASRYPQCKLDAKPAFIKSGQVATIFWTTKGVTSGTLNGAPMVPTTLTKGAKNFLPATTTMYTGVFKGKWNGVTLTAICRVFVIVNAKYATTTPLVTPKYDLSGIVWNDKNGDGVKDDNEPGLPNRIVSLFRNKQVVKTTYDDSGPNITYTTTQVVAGTANTNATGHYSFGSTTLGLYRISHPVPTGYERTTDNIFDFGLYEDSNANFGVRLATTSDTIAPTVYISTPYASSTVKGKAVTVSAIAWDNKGVKGIQFKLDGTNLGSEVTVGNENVGFSYNWDTTKTTDGAHTLLAVARDAKGNRATSTPVDVTVSQAATYTISGNVWIDLNGNAVKDANEKGMATTSVILQNSANRVLQTKVTNTSGNYAFAPVVTNQYSIVHALPAGYARTTPIRVDVTLSADYTANFGVKRGTGDLTPPSIAMTAPAASTVSGKAVTVSAAGWDNVGIVGVQFKLDGANFKAEVTTNNAGTRSVVWNSASTTNGSHTLIAVARDAAGNRATSSPLVVNVSNLAPTATLTQSLEQTVPTIPYVITWSSTNATACTLALKNPAGVINNTVEIGRSGTYVVISGILGVSKWWVDCTGPLGTVHQELLHTVVAAPVTTPTCTLTPAPATIAVGSSASLRWTSTNSDSIVIDHNVGTVTPVVGGAVNVSPTQTTTYTATPHGVGAAQVCSATVTVTNSDGTPTPTDSHTFSKEFSTTQGTNRWYYQYKYVNGTPNGTYANMTWSAAQNRWAGPDTGPVIIGKGFMHPGVSSEAALRWIAPKAGTITITGKVYDRAPQGGNGVSAKIYKGITVLWSAAVANGNTVGKTHSITTTVTAGQNIYFIVNALSNTLYDTTGWDPTITYTAVVSDASSDLSSSNLAAALSDAVVAAVVVAPIQMVVKTLGNVFYQLGIY